jgi:hypothetical protein
MQRLHSIASVRLYSRDAISRVTWPGFSIFDSCYRNYDQFDFGEWDESTGRYVNNQLTLVPELNGLILTPYVSGSQSNYDVHSSYGNWDTYYSDNDAWGSYFELGGGNGHIVMHDPNMTGVAGGGRMMGSPKIQNNPCFAIRLRRYESYGSAIDTGRDYSYYLSCPHTRVVFGGIWMLYIPYNGNMCLMKKGDDGWEIVKTLMYNPAAQSAADVVDVLVLCIDRKIVITMDWFKSAEVYEEFSDMQDAVERDQGIKVAGAPLTFFQKGARIQASVRPLSFATKANLHRLTNPLKVPWGIKYLDNVILKFRCGRDDPVHYVNHGAIYDESTRTVMYSVEFIGTGKETPVLYGIIVTNPPEQIDLNPEDYYEMQSDTFDITIDEPDESESAKTTVSLGTATRVSNKLKYANTVANFTDVLQPDHNVFEGLTNYMVAEVLVGFVYQDGVDVLYPWTNGHPDSCTSSINGDERKGYIRSMSGYVKDPSGSIDNPIRGDFSFDLFGVSTQMKETQCDGDWGPYDGMYVIEMIRDVAWQCGIPDTNILVRTPGAGTQAGNGNMTVTDWGGWDTITEVLNNEDYKSYLEEQFVKLDQSYGADPKWKPKPGEDGWSIAKSGAEYENGLLVQRGMYLCYDPWYVSNLRPMRIKDDDTNITHFEFYGFDTIKEGWLRFTFESQEHVGDYKSCKTTSTQIMADRMSTAIVAVGKDDQNRTLAAVAYNNNNNTGGIFIPFPKRGVIDNPAWGDFGILEYVLRTYSNRVFGLSRNFELNSYAHLEIEAKMYVGLIDSSLAGGRTYGISGSAVGNKKVLRVVNARHRLSSDNPFGASTFSCEQVGILGSRMYEITE